MKNVKKIVIIFYIFISSNLFSFSAQFIENKGILFTWEAEKDVKGVEILYSPSGKEYYVIAVRKYPPLNFSIKDTFLWVFEPIHPYFFNEIIEKGKVKIIYIKENNKEGKILELKNLKLSNLNIKEKMDGFLGFSSFPYGTYPFFPMFQVDVHHTGQYPYVVYPPLTYKWRYRLDYNDFLMISASISSNGVIYVGDGGRFLRAIDINTGKILWEKGLTANVWTTALAYDTLVLAGTSISFDTAAPTFFMLNAKNGETIWAKHFPGLFTVEFQPIVVDTLIYVTTLQWNKTFCITLKGNYVWSVIIDPASSPSGGGVSYENSKIYIGGDCKMYSLDALKGDILWVFETDKWIDVIHPLSINNIVFFFVYGNLYTVNGDDGSLKWKKSGFKLGSVPTPSFFNNFVFFGNLKHVYKLDSGKGDKIWEIFPDDTMIITSIIITNNNILWGAGNKIYSIDAESGKILYKTNYTNEYESWRTCWFFPLIYGPYVIVAHLKNMYIYKGIGFNLPSEKEYFILHPSLISSYGYLFFNLLSEEETKLKIFDISGKLRETINLGKLEKGNHFFVWNPKNFSHGIYFLKWKKEKKKFIYLK